MLAWYAAPMLESPMRHSESVSLDELRELPPFAGLSDPQLEAVTGLARVRSIASGQQLFRQGEPACDLGVVLHGRFSLCVELGSDRELCLLTLTRGEVIGWSAVLDQAAWLACATAVKPSSVLAFHGSALRDLCASDHELGYHVMRNLFAAVAARLHDTRLQLLDMYGHGGAA